MESKSRPVGPSNVNDPGLQTSTSANTFNSDEDVDEYFKNILPTIAAAVKASNALPTAAQYDYYTSYKQFVELMGVEGDRCLELLQRLLKHNGIRCPTLTSHDNLDSDDKFDSLIDANDQLIERINNKLEEADGIKRKPEAQLVVASAPGGSTKAASWNLKKADASSGKSNASYRLLAARFVQRPQLSFVDKVDNSNHPFYPRIQHKPHAVVPLRESLQVPDPVEGVPQPAPNPYKYEIEHFEYSNQQLTTTQPIKPPPLSESAELIYIDTPEQLDKLVDDLAMEETLAIDLEAHSYRSFQGITCLMQLSSRTQDYIIDTLKLRSELHVLNQLFADPRIVKVFHGSDSDVEWLQRDLSLYVVNMFDTHQASKTLGFSRHSLAYLLEHYCQVSADKQYQLADWRIRPLPQELINYAREDTHYLLYIYDCMKNKLIERGNQQQNLLRAVLDKSRELCAKVYQKPVLTEDSCMPMYIRSRKSFNNRQMHALRKLFEWRFKLAQQEDESQAYIMPNHILLQVCEVLPREPEGVLACCTPIPPLVRQHLHTIHSLVVEAREQPISVAQSVRSEARIQSREASSMLDSLHDPGTNRSTDFTKWDISVGPIQSKLSSTLTLMKTSLSETVSEVVRLIADSFVSPLAHYSPLKFVDYSALAQERAIQVLKRHSEVGVNLDSTAKDSPGEDPGPTPAKLAKLVSAESSELNETPKQELVTQQDDVIEFNVSKTKRKKLSKKQPMRQREPTKSAPSKAFAQPDTAFQAYDYSKEDYSEFKGQTASTRNKHKVKGSKKFKDGKFRSESQKSYTYKR